MNKLTSVLLIGLLFFSNINAISIKKNYLGLSSQKGILSDILKNNIEVSKEQNDEYTKITFVIYHDKPLKDKSEQQVNQIAKSIADYLMGEEDEAIQQVAQQQVPQQVQQAVQEAVDQLQELANQQEVTPEQVQQAVNQVIEQLPQDVAEQVKQVVQQLPQQVTPQQVQQVIDQVQQAQQQVAQPQQQVPDLSCQDIAPLEEFVNDLFNKVQDLLNTLTSNKSLLKSFKKSTDDENAENAASNLLNNYVNSFNKLMADLSTVEEATTQADEKCKSQLQNSITQTQTALLQVKSQLNNLNAFWNEFYSKLK